jgi:hypothetical protein
MRMIIKERHAAHPMPQRPTLDERVAWHTEHAARCGCREMPRGVKLELEEREKENLSRKAAYD